MLQDMDGPKWRDKVPPMKILSASTPFVAPPSSSPTSQEKVLLIHFDLFALVVENVKSNIFL